MGLFSSLKSLFHKKPPPETDDDSPLSPDEDPFNEPIQLATSDVLDLHSIPPKQVKAAVEEYLNFAHEQGFRYVRIIHGKGIGVQREVVRSILLRQPFVLSFSDAPGDAGGWGATIVELQS